jgi:hypothetical protein
MDHAADVFYGAFGDLVPDIESARYGVVYSVGGE